MRFGSTSYEYAGISDLKGAQATAAFYALQKTGYVGSYAKLH